MSRAFADEYELQDALGDALREAFGSEAVEREVRLPSGRICDFVVRLPVVGTRLAIEVEHNPEPGAVASDAIHGVGQAVLYAGEIRNAHPLVVVNPAEGDDLDLSALRERVPVVEWSAEEAGA